jgi:hypothetical protein
MPALDPAVRVFVRAEPYRRHPRQWKLYGLNLQTQISVVQSDPTPIGRRLPSLSRTVSTFTERGGGCGGVLNDRTQQLDLTSLLKVQEAHEGMDHDMYSRYL